MSDTSPAARSDQRGRRSLVGLLCSREWVRAVLMGIVELEGRVIAMANCQRGNNALSDTIIEVLKDLERQSGHRLLDDEGLVSHTDIVITGDPIARPRVDLLNVGDSTISAEIGRLIRRLPAVTVDREISAHTRETPEPEGPEGSPSACAAIGIVVGESDESAVWAGAGELLEALSASGDIGSAVVIGSVGEQSLVAQHAGEMELLGIEPGNYEVHQVVASIDEALRRRYRERLSRELGELDGSVSFVPRGMGLDLVARFVGRLQDRQVWIAALPGGLACSDGEDGTPVVLDGPGEFAPGHLAGLIDRCELFESEVRHELSRRVEADPESDDALLRYGRTLAATLGLMELGTQRSAHCDVFIFSQADCDPVGCVAMLDGIGASSQCGVIHILEDWDGLSAMLGALGEDWPAMAADSVLLDLLEPQGAVIQVSGDGDDGELAVTGSIERRDHAPENFAIPFGSLQRFDLQPWGATVVTIQCESGARIGDEEQLTLNASDLQGGSLGLLIDARRMVEKRGQSLRQISSWLVDLE